MCGGLLTFGWLAIKRGQELRPVCPKVRERRRGTSHLYRDLSSRSGPHTDKGTYQNEKGRVHSGVSLVLIIKDSGLSATSLLLSGFLYLSQRLGWL